MENAPKIKWALCGKQSASSETDDELYAYFINTRKSDYAVSTEMLQLEASKIPQKFNIPVTEFKASYRWVP
jgi:hypothetical protein